MILAGLTKLSLIDYPEKLSCIVFTQGCNFRCPFCHNPDILEIKSKIQSKTGLDSEEFFNFLKKNQGRIDAVVVTGGEPTIQTDLIPFLRAIKNLGFLLKLDTNGSRPEIVEKILSMKIVDYWAVDIKNTWSRYHLTNGTSQKLTDKVKLSINLIRNSGQMYEFRTTVVPGLHHLEDMEGLAEEVVKDNFYLQEFRPETVLDSNLKTKFLESGLQFEDFITQFQKYNPKVKIRR